MGLSSNDGSANDGSLNDQGAATAQRTVRYRKPRQEQYAFVGRDLETARRRRTLLESLAERAAEGPARARLWVAASEIAEQHGDIEGARSAMAAAREADPSDLVVLRWWRRDATSRGAWDEVIQLLEQEAALPLSATDRETCASLLAEVLLVQRRDPHAAAAAASAAQEVSGPSMVTGLIGAEAAREAGDAAGAARFLAAGATSSDVDLEVAFRSLAARMLERDGHNEEAAANYSAAAARAPRVDSLMGLARTAGTASRRRDALRSAAEATSSEVFAECLRRAAAQVWLARGDDPAWSVATLEASQRPSSLRLQAHAAQRGGDKHARRAALRALAAASGATMRALALLDVAELQVEEGDFEDADASLKEAALADGELDAVQAVREVLARRAGDSSRLAAAIEGSHSVGRGAIEAAAKLATSTAALASERREINAAIEQGTQPIMADLLQLDVAAESGDTAAVVASLQRAAERATPDRRIGPLLALAERADPVAALSIAREAQLGSPIALRPLARLLSRQDPATAAAAWLEEADAAVETRAAHAAVVAARLFAADGSNDSAIAAATRAHESRPGYWPAAWLLDGDLGPRAAVDRRAELFECLGDNSSSDESRAWAWARRALLDQEDAGATAAWERASELVDDPVCEELALASGEGATVQAERLEERAKAQPSLARASLLRAGLAYERSGDPARGRQRVPTDPRRWARCHCASRPRPSASRRGGP